MNETIGDIPKNAVEKIVVSIGEFKGRQRIDFRIYYKPKVTEDKWTPTKKGINLSAEMWKELKALIPEIDKALSAAE